jgi:hypothetical protein
MDQVTLPRAVVEKVLEALTFYADGSNQELLTGFKDGARIGDRIDWTEERDKLEARGFRMSCEYYNGSENYVEDGRTAQEAADVLREALDQAEHVSEV